MHHMQRALKSEGTNQIVQLFRQTQNRSQTANDLTHGFHMHRMQRALRSEGTNQINQPFQRTRNRTLTAKDLTNGFRIY